MNKKKSPSSPSNQPYTSVLELIKAQPMLSNMVSASENIKRINHIISTTFKGAFAQEMKAVDVKNGIVFIQCRSASVATKMRYHAQPLIEALRKEPTLAHVFNIQCRVGEINSIHATQQQANNVKKTRKASISNYSKHQIKRSAKTIMDDNLRKALLKLTD